MKKQKSKLRKSAWFVPLRGSYLPRTWQGWLSYVPFVAYLLFACIVGWQTTSSVAQAILCIVPNWFAATVAMTWLAKRKS